MGIRSDRQRKQTPANRQPGARSKARVVMSQAAVTAREATVEQSKEIVTKASDWSGQAAGVVLSSSAVAGASALGYHLAPWMVAGLLSTGVAMGGFTSKVINRTIDKLNEGARAADGATGAGAGGGGGAAAEVMARLSEVLQALEAVTQAVDEAAETIGLAQGRVAQATRGARNELARAANAGLRDVPRQLREGRAEVIAGQELVGDFLVQVARGHH